MFMLVAALLLALTRGFLADDALQTLTKQGFDAAIQANGYPPAADPAIYPYFSEATESFSRQELAMFLAQLLHESAGFQHKEELACTGDLCTGKYVDEVGLPSKNYHGRGYIQLTWGANYKDASEALGMGDYLLQNPEVVTNDTRIAVAVSVWFWEAKVRPALVGANENRFGVTTRAIKGDECSAGSSEKAMSRYETYLKVAEVLRVEDKAVESGCYS